MIHQIIEKAKRALDHLQAERPAQNDRLQLAAEAKQRLENKRQFYNDN